MTWTGIVDLLLRSKKKYSCFIIGFFLFTLFPSLSFTLEVESSKDFQDFASFRQEILNLVGTAQTRIWLTTDFISDGEIVSALYLGKYRKLDVLTMLGKKKANSYMSRLNFFKAQGMDVYMRPQDFYS